MLSHDTGAFCSTSTLALVTSPSSLALGDLDADGNLDAVTVNANADTVSVLFGLGDGTFSTLRSYDVGHFPIALAIGDIDGDGQLDICTANRLLGFTRGATAGATCANPVTTFSTPNVDRVSTVNCFPAGGTIIAVERETAVTTDKALVVAIHRNNMYRSAY